MIYDFYYIKKRQNRLSIHGKAVPLQADYYQEFTQVTHYLRVNSFSHWPGKAVRESQKYNARW